MWYDFMKRTRTKRCNEPLFPCLREISIVVMLLIGTAPFTTAFIVDNSLVDSQYFSALRIQREATCLWYSHDRSSGGSKGDYFDRNVLEERLFDLRKKLIEEGYRRPPNPALSPQEFVLELLRALWQNSDPLPDSGFRLLLRSSTKQWRRKLYESVGAPDNANEEVVASALGDAMTRPNNQFAILCGEAERYMATFPIDPLDYSDGTCWVECRLRDKKNDSLYAIIGWQLSQRATDGAWLVDRIDWQDFREEFRPGIGREEWIRICG